MDNCNDCPDCMTNEEAVGEGKRCAAHEIKYLKAKLAAQVQINEDMKAVVRDHADKLAASEKARLEAETGVAGMREAIKRALEEPRYDWRLERMGSMIRTLSDALPSSER